MDDEGQVRDIGGAASWLMADLNASIESARDRDLLIYVHGATVNFYNASAFAAQLDHFMSRDMVSMAFSWPTRQNIIAYGSGGDVRRAYRAAPALASLLELLARVSVARRIHIICWSAGGRVVNSALGELHARHAGKVSNLREYFRIGTLYFAAADVPGDEFLGALSALNDLATRVVVTVSSRDSALEMARTFMRGGRRIGQRNQDLSADNNRPTRSESCFESDFAAPWRSSAATTTLAQIESSPASAIRVATVPPGRRTSSEMTFMSSRYGATRSEVHAVQRRKVFVAVGEGFFQWLERCKHCQQPTLANRLDNQAVAFFAQDGLVPLHLELAGNIRKAGLRASRNCRTCPSASLMAPAPFKAYAIADADLDGFD